MGWYGSGNVSRRVTNIVLAKSEGAGRGQNPLGFPFITKCDTFPKWLCLHPVSSDYVRKMFVTLRDVFPDPYQPIPIVLDVSRGPQCDGRCWYRVV